MANRSRFKTTCSNQGDRKAIMAFERVRQVENTSTVVCVGIILGQAFGQNIQKKHTVLPRDLCRIEEVHGSMRFLPQELSKNFTRRRVVQHEFFTTDRLSLFANSPRNRPRSRRRTMIRNDSDRQNTNGSMGGFPADLSLPPPLFLRSIPIPNVPVPKSPKQLDYSHSIRPKSSQHPVSMLRTRQGPPPQR